MVLYEKNEVIRCHKWADDGQTLFYTKGDRKLTHDRKTHSLIYTLDLKTKQEKVLLGSPENAVDIDISPDGKWLVVLNREVKRTISLIQTAGGVSKELYSFDVMDKDVITPAWSADGKYIYFSSKSISSGREWDMWRLSLEDRRAKKIDLNTVSFRHPSIHPDGRHFIFSTEYDATLDSEVWMIENILPQSKKR